ncbi:zinc-binding dehydrogenase [Pleurocapsales cyanobacterium LEGE 06147]|nr:zinc-binding dehydrogenase [Pleurocapsales cyanobacterium LEGE 06147]
MTAWQALFEVGSLQSGQSVLAGWRRQVSRVAMLIHGAAGGVGSYAVQFAKLRGIRVFGTASAINLDYVRQLGADEVIDYKNTPFEQAVNAVDMVLDTVGGETQTRSFNVLKPGGILVTTAAPPDLKRLPLKAFVLSRWWYNLKPSSLSKLRHCSIAAKSNYQPSRSFH